MKISLRKAAIEEKDIIISLFKYYMYEFSDILNSTLQADGSYLKNTALIDPYWREPDHTPYFILVDEEIAGFVFIRKFPNEQGVFDVDQFFILRKFNRQGVGRSAFALCSKEYPGNWLVRVLKENTRGLAFWENVVGSITDGKFEHSYERDEGVEMHFFRFTV